MQHMDYRCQRQHSPPRAVCRLHGQLRAAGPVHGVHACQHPGRPDARHRRTSRHPRARLADFPIPAGDGCQGQAERPMCSPYQRAAALGPTSCVCADETPVCLCRHSEPCCRRLQAASLPFLSGSPSALGSTASPLGQAAATARRHRQRACPSPAQAPTSAYRTPLQAQQGRTVHPSPKCRRQAGCRSMCQQAGRSNSSNHRRHRPLLQHPTTTWCRASRPTLCVPMLMLCAAGFWLVSLPWSTAVVAISWLGYPVCMQPPQVDPTWVLTGGEGAWVWRVVVWSWSCVA